MRSMYNKILVILTPVQYTSEASWKGTGSTNETEHTSHLQQTMHVLKTSLLCEDTSYTVQGSVNTCAMHSVRTSPAFSSMG